MTETQTQIEPALVAHALRAVADYVDAVERPIVALAAADSMAANGGRAQRTRIDVVDEIIEAYEATMLPVVGAVDQSLLACHIDEVSDVLRTPAGLAVIRAALRLMVTS